MKLGAFESNWSKKNIDFKIHYAFRTQPLDFELGLLLPLMISKLTWDLPKFRTQLLVIKFEPRDTLKQILNAFIQSKMHCTHLELLIF